MSSKFYVKKHLAENKVIVAVCDEEILGKEFREGDIVLSIPRSFYEGEKVDLEEAIHAILRADIAVVSGRRIVEELIRRGIVVRESVLQIRDQLHVQIVRELV